MVVPEPPARLPSDSDPAGEGTCRSVRASPIGVSAAAAHAKGAWVPRPRPPPILLSEYPFRQRHPGPDPSR